MLLPTSIASHITSFASRDSTRYQLTGAFLERTKEGKAFACATDGKVLCQVTWKDEDPGYYPEVPGFSLDHKPGFKAIIATADLLKMAKSAPRATCKMAKAKPILAKIAIDEIASNGRVPTVTTDLETTSRIDVQPIEGTFPDYTVATKPLKQELVRIRVNAEYLAKALVALVGMVPDKDNPCIDLVIQDAEHPIRLERSTPEIQALGLVMPVLFQK